MHDGKQVTLQKGTTAPTSPDCTEVMSLDRRNLLPSGFRSWPFGRCGSAGSDRSRLRPARHDRPGPQRRRNHRLPLLLLHPRVAGPRARASDIRRRGRGRRCGRVWQIPVATMRTLTSLCLQSIELQMLDSEWRAVFARDSTRCLHRRRAAPDDCDALPRVRTAVRDRSEKHDVS